MNIRCLDCDIEMDNFDDDRWLCSGCGGKVEVSK